MEFCPYGNLHTAGKTCYVCPLLSAEALDKATAGSRVMDLKNQKPNLVEQIVFLYSELFNKPHCELSLQNQYLDNL